jgi:hypothetical protein
VTFDIEPYYEIVRLTVTHQNLAGEEALEAISAGWPAVFANLKSLLETGHVLPRAPWEMHAAQMARHDGPSGAAGLSRTGRVTRRAAGQRPAGRAGRWRACAGQVATAVTA